MSKASKIRESVIEQAEILLSARGWKEDRWGNWKSPKRTYRIKFKPRIVRIEHLIQFETETWSGKMEKHSEWRGTASATYAKMSLGKLASVLDRLNRIESERGERNEGQKRD